MMICKLFKKKVAKPVEKVHPNIISVGKHTYNHLLAEIGSCKCKIGNFCSIAKGAKIGVSQHIVKISSHPFYYEKEYGNFIAQSDYSEYDLKNQPVEIGNDVWIGANTVIMPSVKIGNGAIIGAGSIITKNIPPYAITGGGRTTFLNLDLMTKKLPCYKKQNGGIGVMSISKNILIFLKMKIYFLILLKINSNNEVHKCLKFP